MDNKKQEKLSNDKIPSALTTNRPKFPVLNGRLLDLLAKFHGEVKLNQFLNDENLVKRALGSFPLTLPIYLYEFVLLLTKDLKVDNSFDPWLTPSSPIVHLPIKSPKGICLSADECSLIREGFRERNIEATQGIALNEMDSIEDQFDLILSLPPMGKKTPAVRVSNVEYTGDFSYALLIKSLARLSPAGKAVFLLSPSFLGDNEFKSVLSKLGFKIEAMFYVSPGALQPTTSVSSYFIIVSKGHQSDVFVAEVSSDESVNNTVVSNYLNRRQGKQPQLGSLVDMSSFKSFPALVASKEFETLVRQFGFDGLKLHDIAVSITFLKESRPEEIEHSPNSLYLPKIGKSEVVTSPLDLTLKPHNYYKIVIDDTKANATYVANYFNGQIGMKLRESLQVGSLIPQIPLSGLKNCVVHLPDLISQFEIIQIDNKINQFSSRLEELKRTLWKSPRRRSSIIKELKTINHEEKLVHWIDALPFPLSSILWRYYATKSDGKKVEHLFHFFEALSEFMSMIMLSALIQDRDFYKQECHKWIDNDEKFKDWYLRATFGNWNALTGRLSKATREYLNDKQKKEMSSALYGNPSDSFLNVLTNKAIVNILEIVRELRNKWKGHGGISSEQENRNRVTILEQQLNELKKQIADGFEETTVVAPLTGSFEDGIFLYNVKELLGARTPFKEATINSLIPLDRKKLYLVHKNRSKPLELLPFIKYVEDSNAIYFYTSIESKDVRWVSYHFESEPELRRPVDDDLYKAFDLLK